MVTRRAGRDELAERLRGSTYRLPDAVRERHLRAMTAAASTLPARPVVPTPGRRRMLAGMVAAAMLAGPAGVAIAAEGALPGSTLHPVKRAAETVRRVIDPEVVARHRIEELQALLALEADEATIAAALAAALAAVSDLPPEHPLQARLRAMLTPLHEGPTNAPPLVDDETEEEHEREGDDEDLDEEDNSGHGGGDDDEDLDDEDNSGPSGEDDDEDLDEEDNSGPSGEDNSGPSGEDNSGPDEDSSGSDDDISVSDGHNSGSDDEFDVDEGDIED